MKPWVDHRFEAMSFILEGHDKRVAIGDGNGYGCSGSRGVIGHGLSNGDGLEFSGTSGRLIGTGVGCGDGSGACDVVRDRHNDSIPSYIGGSGYVSDFMREDMLINDMIKSRW